MDKSGPRTRVGPLIKIQFFHLSFQYDNDLIATTENTSCWNRSPLKDDWHSVSADTGDSRDFFYVMESIRALCLEVVDEVVADVLRPLPRGIPGLNDVAVLVELGLPVDEVSHFFPCALALPGSQP